MKHGALSATLALMPLMPQSFANNWVSPVEVNVYQGLY